MGLQGSLRRALMHFGRNPCGPGCGQMAGTRRREREDFPRSVHREVILPKQLFLMEKLPSHAFRISVRGKIS